MIEEILWRVAFLLIGVNVGWHIRNLKGKHTADKCPLCDEMLPQEAGYHTCTGRDWSFRYEVLDK